MINNVTFRFFQWLTTSLFTGQAICFSRSCHPSNRTSKPPQWWERWCNWVSLGATGELSEVEFSDPSKYWKKSGGEINSLRKVQKKTGSNLTAEDSNLQMSNKRPVTAPRSTFPLSPGTRVAHPETTRSSPCTTSATSGQVLLGPYHSELRSEVV